MFAPDTLTFRGRHYAKGVLLPDDVARGLGLIGDDAAGGPARSTDDTSTETPDSNSLTLKDEIKAVVRAVVERRAAAGDQQAVDALAEMADDEAFDAAFDGFDQAGDDEPDDEEDGEDSESDDQTDPRAPYTLAPAGGSWFQVLDASGQEVQKVNGREAADAALASLNAGKADGTAA
ncbi:MAG TPA: hypothetical protein VGB53_00795 [Rubricoccaceae bacterium]|jgi:hypothetical protein